MPFYTDQLNRTIEVKARPQKIISVVPSQTELLHYLGLEKEVIGITKFCIHPDKWFREKQRVGGTKNLHLQKIKELHPDLIIANKEENLKEQIEELANQFPVWVSDVNNLEDSLDMIEKIGRLTAREKEADGLLSRIKSEFEKIQFTIQFRTAYLIWKDPYMTVGGDTFIHDMLRRAGFENIFAVENRYPTVSIEDIKNANCELLLLSSEPYPFQQKHIDELQAFLPNTKIMLVDGEMFSWYGSRLVKAPNYFSALRQQIGLIV